MGGGCGGGGGACFQPQDVQSLAFVQENPFSVKLEPILLALLHSDRTQKICVQYKIILCCLVRSTRLFVPVAF